MSTILAQESGPGLLDNGWPNQFYVPFGEWIKELVFWAVNNQVTSTIGDIIEWPFSTMFDLILSDDPTRDSIQTIPWVWMVIGVFLVASFTRNTRVGLTVSLMLAVCGFLGPQYWDETSRTIGMVLISVTLCAVVGIPLGVLSGRIDGVWNVVRPALDAMQVVHSFVFMLPFIFFFGVGDVSATMVTMVFALPPIVRLTNLGIRQVPEDVVEASRAYGAREMRVLFDVQIPLARPAILAGLNQTLLLAISMLGIAAIMGAGGLGKLLLRAIQSTNLPLASLAGVAFFLVAVVLDRITQTEADDGVPLSQRLANAWRFRSEPEAYLEAQAEAAEKVAEKKAKKAADAEPAERPAPVTARERMGLTIGIAGAVLAIVSIFLTWASNAGLLSSWARAADVNLNGELEGLSFNGIEASGGTIFGLAVGVLGFVALLCYVRPLLRFSETASNVFVKVQGAAIAALVAIIVVVWLLNVFGLGIGPLSTIGLWIFAVLVLALLVELFVNGTHRLGVDGGVIAAMGALGAVLGYMFLNGGPEITNYSEGIGVIVALIGAGLMVVGGGIAMLSAPYSPHIPLAPGIAWGRIIGVAVGFLFILGGSFLSGNDEKKSEFGWFYDERQESLVTPEFLAEVERIEAEAGADPSRQIVAANTIANMYNALATERLVYTGYESDGPQLGWLVSALGVLAVLVMIPSATTSAEMLQWRSGTALSGLGLALMVIPAAFIVGIVRVAEPNALPGIGAFVAFVGGFVIFISGRAVVGDFRRKKLYSDHRIASDSAELLDDLHVDESELEAANA